MKNELTILNQLKSVIQSQLNNYLPQGVQAIDSNNVAIDYPDVDLMPKSTMFYLVENYAEYEPLSTESDGSIFNISAYILCKKDTQANLTIKTHAYFNALHELLRNNIGLDNYVDFVDVASADFYKAVEANKNVQAVEIAINIRYTKDF